MKASTQLDINVKNRNSTSQAPEQIKSKSINNNGKMLKRSFFKQPPIDYSFFIIAMLLLITGLIMLFSVGYASALYLKGNSYYYIQRQAIFAVIGFLGMIFASIVPYNLYKPFVIPAYIGSVILLIAVLVLPSRDAQKRWIYIGGFQFQPSEIAKLMVIIMLALYLSNVKTPTRQANEKFLEYHSRAAIVSAIIPAILFGLCAGLVLIETHLSGGILIALVGIGMIIASGCRFPYAMIIISVMLIAALAVLFFTDYMQARIITFLNPEADMSGDGYQINQSLYAIGSGGLFGVGFGRSRQKYLYLPEPQNDFIFSIISEEVGFIGVLFIIIMFALLVWRGMYIAMNAPNKFSSLIVFGIMARIAFQVLLNLAVVSNAIPVTGISLPFFSYGGTALAILLVEIGIVLQISRYSYLQKE